MTTEALIAKQKQDDLDARNRNWLLLDYTHVLDRQQKQSTDKNRRPISSWS